MSVELWATVLAAIEGVEQWNANLSEFKRLTEQYGEECREFIKAEAERRGYLWSKESKQYIHPWQMKACSGKNVIGVGWKGGQLAVVFASKDGPRRYESVSFDVPIETAEKLVRSPFPDNLYQQIVKNKGILMRRVL